MTLHEADGPKPTVLGPVVTFGLPTCLILVSVLADHVPRFMQGDSVSYLMTGNGWIPPDRSWAFGFAVHWLLSTTRTYTSYILINNALLIVLIVHCRSYFPRTRGAGIAYAVCATAIAADPLIAVYTRFYLSDFLGLFFFIGFIGAFRSYLLGAWAPRRAMALMLAFAVGAVFTRVAYALIIGLLIAIVLVWTCLRASARIRWRAASALLLPCAAVAALAAANMALLSGQFGPRPFVNKLSGAFLMSFFAPALAEEDFRKAGVAVSDQEFADFDLTNFDQRARQVWGTDTRSARPLIMARLGIGDEYSEALDRTCVQIVLNALQRNPIAFLRVYLHSLYLYFSVGEWRKFLDTETGINRLLEADFVNYFNSMSEAKIYPDIVRENSPTLRVYRAVLIIYPVLLGVCSFAAVYFIARRRSDLTELILSAAFIAALLAAALYSDYVIPRYVIASVFLGYLLLALLVQSRVEARARSLNTGLLDRCAAPPRPTTGDL